MVVVPFVHTQAAQRYHRGLGPAPIRKGVSQGIELFLDGILPEIPQPDRDGLGTDGVSETEGGQDAAVIGPLDGREYGSGLPLGQFERQLATVFLLLQDLPLLLLEVPFGTGPFLAQFAMLYPDIGGRQRLPKARGVRRGRCRCACRCLRRWTGLLIWKSVVGFFATSRRICQFCAVMGTVRWWWMSGVAP